MVKDDNEVSKGDEEALKGDEEVLKGDVEAVKGDGEAQKGERKVLKVQYGIVNPFNAELLGTLASPAINSWGGGEGGKVKQNQNIL